MRLDDFDPNINVEDQGRGGGGFNLSGGGGGGLIFALLPMLFSRLGCLGTAIVAGLFLAFGGLGSLGGLTGGGGAPATSSAPSTAGGSASQICSASADRKNACNAFSSADKTWARLLGNRFEAPKLVFYTDNGQSGCGAAQSAMGPFYCPQDRGIFLDVSFFRELAGRFGAAGDFAQDYVIAHEFGHHVQNLLGTSTQVSRMQARASQVEGNHLSVMLELQADCYAGVWAAANRDRLEPGDLEEGMTAARAIGDDTLQRQSQGRVVPDSFTHGTSEQRMTWLRRGIDSGDPAQCDTFQGALGG